MNKKYEKALEEAKGLEKKEIPSAEETGREYEEAMQKAAQAQKLLKPAWYLKGDRKKSCKK